MLAKTMMLHLELNTLPGVYKYRIWGQKEFKPTDVWDLNTYQKEKLGTLGRVPEIYTNIYHLYMDSIMVVSANMG